MPEIRPSPIGPILSQVMLEEEHRRVASAVFSSLYCQAAILLTSILSIGIAGMMFWVQLIRYNAALAACAGV